MQQINKATSSRVELQISMPKFRKIGQVARELWSCVACFKKNSATEEQILECQKAIHEFLSYAIFKKQSCTVTYNASSGQSLHLPPLFISNMDVSPSVSVLIKGIVQDLETCGGKFQGSVDNLGNAKLKIRDLECQILLQVNMLNPVIRSVPYTVFVAQLPQGGEVTHNQHLRTVKVTDNSSVLEVPFNIEGAFFVDIAKEINGELQAHYNDGIMVAYLVDDEVGLTRIAASDLCIKGKASGVTQQGMINGVQKIKKY